MDPVGMTKACTRVVVPKSSRMMVTVHSAIKPRGGSALAGGGVGAFFSSATVATLFGSTVTYCSESLIFCGKRRSNLERPRHPIRADFGKTRPPPAPGTGILLHADGRGRADPDEDRSQ